MFEFFKEMRGNNYLTPCKRKVLLTTAACYICETVDCFHSHNNCVDLNAVRMKNKQKIEIKLEYENMKWNFEKNKIDFIGSSLNKLLGL